MPFSIDVATGICSQLRDYLGFSYGFFKDAENCKKVSIIKTVTGKYLGKQMSNFTG
jgi:hypothetical protein